MHEPTLATAEQADLRQYRNVSRLAIVALLLGIVSPVALAHPLLWIVPLAGVVLATGGLVSIARQELELTGRGMATWGLVLSLFFGSWGMGQVSLRDWILRSQAEALADHWIALWEAGELEQAHQLTMPSTERQPEGTDLKLFYPTVEHADKALQSMGAVPPNKWLKEIHERGGEIHFRRVEYHSQDSEYEDNFVLLYDLRIDGEQGPDEYQMNIHVTRKYYNMLGIVDWYIHDTTVPGAKPF